MDRKLSNHLCFLLVLSLLVITTVGCSSEAKPCNHNWNEATCIQPKTCSKCGEVEGDTIDHLWVEAEDGSSRACSVCGKEIHETISGSGDDVISNISIGKGNYRIHITNAGKHSFSVISYDSDGGVTLLVNHAGPYDGYVYLPGSSPFTFEISSKGDWTFTIEQLSITDSNSFSGNGDCVTDIFAATSGTWEFTHDGKRNFSVILHTTDGRTLLVNSIGEYSGKKVVTIPKNSNAFLEINADANWIARPIS